MPDWLIAIILGIIEGLTEFIPVSSTGHLIIAEHWFNLGPDSFFKSDLFNSVIQCGAVLAVLPLFRSRLAMLMRWRERASQLYIAKILLVFGLTGVVGLILDKRGYKLTENVVAVAIALIVGGIIFIIVEKWLAHHSRRDTVSWPAALATTVGQLLAVIFPGASRSGSTIMLAMLAGTKRPLATEFSFLVGIPTLLAAGALKTFKALHHADPTVAPPQWGLLALAALVAAAVSFVAVRWLLVFVQTHTFVSFGIYRIILGVILLIFFLR